MGTIIYEVWKGKVYKIQLDQPLQVRTILLGAHKAALHLLLMIIPFVKGERRGYEAVKYCRSMARCFPLFFLPDLVKMPLVNLPPYVSLLEAAS